MGIHKQTNKQVLLPTFFLMRISAVLFVLLTVACPKPNPSEPTGEIPAKLRLSNDIDALSNTLSNTLSNAMPNATTDVIAGRCTGPFTVSALDQTGKPFFLSETLSIKQNASAEISYFVDERCRAASTAIALLGGSSSRSFYIRFQSAGVKALLLSNEEFDLQATLGVYVSPVDIYPSSLSLSFPTLVTAATCVSDLKVSALDYRQDPFMFTTDYGILIESGGDFPVTLFSDSNCAISAERTTHAISVVTIPQGATETSFSARFQGAGAQTFFARAATNNPLRTGVTITVNPALVAAISPVSVIQPTTVNKWLGDNVGFVVIDSSGFPIPNIPIHMTVTKGDGKILLGSADRQNDIASSTLTLLSDNNGRVLVQWQLGTLAAVNSDQLTATFDDGDQDVRIATLDLTATAGERAAIVVASGDQQNGQVNTALSAPIVAQVIDDFGNSVADQGVIFSITTAASLYNPPGATLGTTSTTTDNTGLAATMLTLGSQCGEYTVTASILLNSVATSISFTAQASGGLNGTLFYLGGRTGTQADSSSSQVLRSDDGCRWQALSNFSTGTMDSARAFLGAASYNSKIWLVGGEHGGTDLSGNIISVGNSESTSSIDLGVNWVVEAPVPLTGGVTGLSGITILPFDDGTGERLWAMGGFDSSTDTSHNSVWSFDDLSGGGWATEAGLPGGVLRDGLGAVVFKGSLYVAGGSDGGLLGTAHAEVYRYNTTNSQWDTVAPLPAARTGGALLAHDYNGQPELLYVGGADSNQVAQSSIWASSDGLNWVMVGDLPAPRAAFASTFTEGRLYVIGGASSLTTYHNTVWVSDDGRLWRNTETLVTSSNTTTSDHTGWGAALVSIP